uniref:Retrovirus-related Pol polyprotein from transposon TNT 1-94 n=1 Tax=Cajanus cajan TaxID=3821 RepID=A0A151SBI0_CAJCA|nr:hypothetical protein KK1_025999 [Cajanus cajan]
MVQLWFCGQGHADHLTTKAFVIATDERAQWQQIDASLYTILWFSIALTLQHSYQAFDKCYDVWIKAKKVYTNNVQCLYNVITTMMTTKLENMDMQTYLSKLKCLIANYNNLMPYPSNKETFEQQRHQYFMILALVGLLSELEFVRNQILSAHVVPIYNTISERLLHLCILHNVANPFASSVDSFALVSHSSNHGSGRGGNHEK